MTDEPEVLVVDDEARLADLFAAWLGTERPVAAAYNGEQALEMMTDTIEVVLLDRRMPGLSGDEVLQTIREEGYDCRVVMVTAVDPDFDIIEMGFDDYLVKPVSKDELLEMVKNVSTRSDYKTDIQEYYALVSKKALLESEKADRELADHDEYQQLCARVDELRDQVDETVSGMSSHDDFVGAFQDLQGEN
ncbi:HalX domain-containing protein [Natrialbaceae archaeon A-CW2]|uniref:HalX domain-containing protein n=1 Tax=Natronosalvus amylolyticus TaxID=2961994 RepID=UPI0020C9EB17|nr:HalX domain-containing protein [Natronosalvus amylolyticus]